MPVPVVALGLAVKGAKMLAKKRGKAGVAKRVGRGRRRRARLTATDMLELTQIKNILGKTAAAQAMPFYLRRR